MAKILLVEDDNSLREIYQARLEAEGYETSSAQDGEEALVVAKQEKPDLVISDVMMPKISGFEMLDILRNTAGLEHVKVIMLTALGQTEDRNQADSLGADKYLVKSQVTLEDIVKTAHDLLIEDGVEAPASEETPSDTKPPQADNTVPEAEHAAAPPQVEEVAPAPAPEPQTVQPQPATEPNAEQPPATQPETTSPEPEQSAETAQETEPTQPDQGGSVAQEEEYVKDQIDQFLNNQTPSPTTDESSNPADSEPQAQASTAEPTTSQQPNAEPEQNTSQPSEPNDTTAEQTAAATNDDKLMQDAINQLSGDTTQPATENAASAEGQPNDASTSQDNEDVQNSNASGRKIIKPISKEPQPNVNDLLAKEEAMNTEADAEQNVQPNANPSTPSSEQSTPASATNNEQQDSSGDDENKPPSQSGGFDPNNVAL